MAEWSTLSKETPLDCIEVEPFSAFHGIVKDHADVDDSADHDKVKQKSLFNRLFSIYLKENYSRGIVRPLPVLLGDGQVLDLYQLFSLVKEKGGYAVVSRNRSWHHVTKELGLDLRVWVSVKLVYDKYLSDFEGWLRKTFEDKRFKIENRGHDWGFKSLPIDLEKEFRSLLGSNLKDKDADFVQLESSNIMKHIDLINHKSDANGLDTKSQTNICKDVQHVDGDDDDDEKICNIVKNDLAASLAEIAGKEIKSRKRKRETLPGMLNWMRHVATHPLDSVAQPLPKSSKLKECKGREPFGQILRTRDVLALKDHVEPNSGPSSQKLKMHPAMYDDEVAVSQESPVKSRSSERLPVKSRCSCSNSSCSANGSRSPCSANVDPEKCPREKTTAKIDLAAKKAKKKVSEPPVNDFSNKKVSIGPRFQADVPEWTGVVTESDSKWLGTQLWPEKHDSKPGTQRNLVGSRRREKCNCHVQGSVECVRFHTAENRMKLKLELGPAFFHLGFDQMGEEVTLRWTSDEEKKFKDVMRTKDPSQIKTVWQKKPSKYFRKKTRKDMVSYYFNVFVIGLRSYQNRVTPKNVDSDDDEVEFGSCGDGFGMKAIKGPVSGAEFLQCSENKQCTDLEE